MFTEVHVTKYTTFKKETVWTILLCSNIFAWNKVVTVPSPQWFLWCPHLSAAVEAVLPAPDPREEVGGEGMCLL